MNPEQKAIGELNELLRRDESMRVWEVTGKIRFPGDEKATEQKLIAQHNDGEKEAIESLRALGVKYGWEIDGELVATEITATARPSALQKPEPK